MRLNYKKRLFLYFILIFSIFTLIVVVMQQIGEKKNKTETLQQKLEEYVNIVYKKITINSDIKPSLDSLVIVFPPNLRLSLIDKTGNVIYDNALHDISQLKNHLNRPEILEASRQNWGTDIHVSQSNHIKYLYYAKKFPDYYVRVALPYDIQTRAFLHADNVFIYYIILLFVGMIILVNYVADRFGKSIKQLRDFAISPEKFNLSEMQSVFPHDELGEIGIKLADNYKQLKENEQKIILEKEKLLRHIHTSKEGLCFFSTDRKVEFFNALFTEYLCLIVDDDDNNPEIIFSDPIFNAINLFLTQQNRKLNYFETNINKQGKYFLMRINIFEDKSFEIIINDVTDYQEMQSLKHQMTANIAHELRTPITSIHGFLETILSSSLSPEKIQYFVEKAYNQTINLAQLVQDIGLITKIEEAPQSFHFENINLQDLISTLKNDLKKILDEKNIQIASGIHNTIIKGNYNLIYAVFRNLIENVANYAGNDITISINEYNEDRNYYHFSFADNGVGIQNEEHLKHLFERFYRVNEGRTRETGGSGLGLSIVKNAVQLHKGTISVKNRVHGGLEFLFKLPKAGNE